MGSLLALLFGYLLIMALLVTPWACTNLRVSCARCTWEQTRTLPR